jgi:hypothetical protein
MWRRCLSWGAGAAGGFFWEFLGHLAQLTQDPARGARGANLVALTTSDPQVRWDF